jgi:hypothetical protein
VRIIPVLFSLMLVACCSSPPDMTLVNSTKEGQKDDQYRRELEEIRKGIRGDVKIRLKRDGKGEFYSWEVSGKDANEVLKANDILSKKLDQK